MGRNHYVYLKSTDGFSVSAFADYCAQLGLHVKVHPDFNWQTHTGFLPMRLTDRRFGGNRDFLTGFGFYMAECPKTPFNTPQIAELTDFEQAVRGSVAVLALRCSGEDPFERLPAYLFGGYLVTHLGGVFVDHQTGAHYTTSASMEEAIRQLVIQLQEDTSLLLTRPFAGWS